MTVSMKSSAAEAAAIKNTSGEAAAKAANWAGRNVEHVVSVIGKGAATGAVELQKHPLELQQAKYDTDNSGRFGKGFKTLRNAGIAFENGVSKYGEKASTGLTSLSNKGIIGLGGILGKGEAWLWKKLFDAEGKSPISDLVFGILAVVVAFVVRLAFVAVELAFRGVSMLVTGTLGAVAGAGNAAFGAGKAGYKAAEHYADTHEFQKPVNFEVQFKSPIREINPKEGAAGDSDMMRSSVSSVTTDTDAEESSFSDSGDDRDSANSLTSSGSDGEWYVPERLEESNG